jgi:1-deoxy-D-xylulose-5-phosphate synthase
LLHVVTEKGHGFEPAAEDPVFFHTPPAFERANGKAIPKPQQSSKTFTDFASSAIRQQMLADPSVTTLTAAMCQGNKLEAVREEFPDRFFDTGICESHTVAFAAGLAKSGLRPIVDIYSTFLQRSFDQIFQEVSLQNLPVVFMMDRAGLTGPDGPTHHGAYDLAYMRMFPHLAVMAPADGDELQAMLQFAVRHDTACGIRYPKAKPESLPGVRTPIEPGRAEVLYWGSDGLLLGCGSLVSQCLHARELLLDEGLDVGVVNARFVKPIDEELIRRALTELPFVVTVEEGVLMGGFGSAVLETASQAGLDTRRLQRLGIPDEFVEHGTREELLATLRLDAAGIAQTCRRLASQSDVPKDTAAPIEPPIRALGNA